MTLSNDSRDRVKHAFEPIALAMGRAGLTPDGLTVIGFAITVVGAILLAGQQWLLGGLVVLAGGVFDMFDGTLARATGRVSKLGAFMDSVFDRWGEAIVYLGIVVGCVVADFDLGAILAAAAMGAAFMVSYARSKSEGLGFTAGNGMAAVGIMPRELRLIVLALGLILAGALGGIVFDYNEFLFPVYGEFDRGRGALTAALTIISIGATITTIQRILHVRSQALRQSTTPQAGVPASNGETNT
jgi:CDP-diacylglycerol--glycerol-3-phosphate 3-phosphatidyltransferase